MAKQLITGIRLCGSELQWTTLRNKKGATEVQDHQETTLEFASVEVPERNSPEMVAVLKKACAGIKGDIGSSVPSDQALMRVAELPSTDVDELQGMVELQVDKISPFPAEHMAVSYEIVNQSESTSRVLIVGVRNEFVDELGEIFGGTGHTVHWVDVDILGWWQLLLDSGSIDESGRQFLLLSDEGGTELVVTHDGIPVLFRALGVGGELSPEGVEELVEDIGYTLTTLEAEWGTAERTHVAIWSSGNVPEELTHCLHTDYKLPVEVHDLRELPPLSEGLARRFARTKGKYINLAPRSWVDREHSRHARHVLVALTVVFLSIWLGCVTAFMFMLGLQQKDLLNIQTASVELEAEAEEAKEIGEKVKSLERYADRSRSALECLREVSLLMPQGGDLTSFTFRKGKNVAIRGESPNEGPIYDFIAALEKSDMFVEAKSGDIKRKRRKSGTITEFTVTAALPGDAS